MKKIQFENLKERVELYMDGRLIELNVFTEDDVTDIKELAKKLRLKLSTEQISEIIKKSSGFPILIDRLLRELSEGKLNVSQLGKAFGPKLQILCDRYRDSFQSRDLSDEEREVARQLSVLEMRLDFEQCVEFLKICCPSCAVNDSKLNNCLIKLCQKGIFREFDHDLRWFIHDLMQSCIYEDVKWVPNLCESYHGAALEFYEKRGGIV